MSDTDTTDWELDRLPKIKAELEEHGYVCWTTKSVSGVYGFMSCGAILVGVVGASLIGAGLATNAFLGAGLGLLISSVLLGWRWKRAFYAHLAA